MLFNVFGLVSDRYLCQTRQVDEGKRQHVGREYAQVDGLWGNTSVATRLCLCVTDDLCTNFVEVIEFLARQMQKFSPFRFIGLLI